MGGTGDEQGTGAARRADLRHIGEVAELTGLSHRTIRYYEEMGLVTPAARTDGGFRLYDAAGVERLRLITPMKPLGYSIEEIRELLQALDALTDPSAPDHLLEAAHGTLRRSQTRTEERIEDLRAQITRAEEFAGMVGTLLAASRSASR